MRKLPHTPSSQIRSALRKMWLRSRERQEALKLAQYTCAKCDKKQSKAKGREVKVEVHHLDGIDWNGIIELIRERILHNPNRLQVLCKECHREEGEKP